MSKVVLLLNAVGPRRVEVTSVLRKALGVAIQDVSRAVPTIPLVERELFDRNTPQFAQTLLKLMTDLADLGASLTVYQLLDHQSYVAEEKYYEITIERLRNLIANRERSLAEQRTLDSDGTGGLP